MTVRRAHPADLSPLLELVREFYVVDRHDFDESRVVAGLGPMLADDSVGQVWVIDDVALTGYAIVTWSWSLESGGRDCILDEIYVRERDRGHGGALIEHALTAAEAAGARAIFLETEAHNSRVRGFYARHGFTREDSVWMAAPLPRNRS